MDEPTLAFVFWPEMVLPKMLWDVDYPDAESSYLAKVIFL
jgi:hypothetical protein